MKTRDPNKIVPTSIRLSNKLMMELDLIAAGRYMSRTALITECLENIKYILSEVDRVVSGKSGFIKIMEDRIPCNVLLATVVASGSEHQYEKYWKTFLPSIGEDRVIEFVEENKQMFEKYWNR